MGRKATGDGIRMFLGFFPFLFWGILDTSKAPSERYCRNDFSLFSLFIFSVKKFFFYFFILFSVCVCHRIIRRKKKQKITFKREKGKNIAKKFSKPLCFILRTGKWDFSLFFSV